MKRSDLQSYTIPDAPGVYFFLNDQKKILYIGKATSLRNRVRSYFANDLLEKRSALIAQMTEEATQIEWTETDSVLEALILETNLIRTHKPHYNTRSKDDKSYNYLIITKEDWSRVLVVRERDLTEQFTKEQIAYEFGPYPSGQLLREALRIVRKLFRFYDLKKPVDQVSSKLGRGIINFNQQIGLYPDTKDPESYTRTIRHIRLFFQGKKKVVIKELTKEMMRLAKTESFEEANRIKKQIFALEHIQDIALLKKSSHPSAIESEGRIEAYDIAHLAGQHMVGVMTVVYGHVSRNSEYRKFKITSVNRANDTAALREVLTRRFTHTEWPIPQVLVVDGSTAQINVAKAVLQEYDLQIPIAAVVKNAQHKPERLLGDEAVLTTHKEGILLANAEAHRFAINYYRDSARKNFTGRSKRA